jgi:hypothetical protein
MNKPINKMFSSPLSANGERGCGPKIDLFQNTVISEHSALKKPMLQGISGTLLCNMKKQLTAVKTLVCKENSFFCSLTLPDSCPDLTANQQIHSQTCVFRLLIFHNFTYNPRDVI